MIRGLIGLAPLFLAGPAHAHGTIPGGAGFYAGFVHPFVTPEHLICLIAVGLLMGRMPAANLAGLSGGQPYKPRRLPIAGLFAGIVLGLGLSAMGLRPTGAAGGILVQGALVLAMATGLCLTTYLWLPVWGIAVLAAIAGSITSLDTDLATIAGLPNLATALPYLGLLAGITIITLNAMALASVVRRPPYTIALRVAGSWIAAIGLLVLVLSLRGIGGGP